MQDELRLSLLIAGTLFIIAIFAHGMWKIRKQSKPEEKKSRLEPRSWDIDDDDELNADEGAWREEDMGRRSESIRASQQGEDFDELGVGKVRVVKPNADDPSSRIVEGKEGDKALSGEQEMEPPAEKASKPATAEPEIKLYGSVVSNPKPHMQNPRHAGESEKDDIPAPPGFLLKKEAAHNQNTENSTPDLHSTPAPKMREQEAEVDDFSLDSQPAPIHMNEANEKEQAEGESLTEQARRFMSRKRSKPSTKKGRQEPKFGDDQMRIDFDDSAEKSHDHADPEEVESAGHDASQQSTLPEQEVLVLNVKAAEDAPISGAALLPMLLTLGFKFGEQDIFHRHVNSNGKGPVLFSLANMFKPGVFDIDNLETFTTQGVSLFMILPIEGDAHQVFNMMHNAARKIADEFGAQVLDGRRSVMTKQGLQQYIERIREFERLRMVKR
ncbi:cell division protein ZipA [Alteromonas ponticola]|uniref:Cell division protein ZipA n=2 Tax=Alteromonas aquimaris TaxID=2998417 RepID=A0ABT3P7Q9_9ALTE|nr:cell division protein ZipA [Alteromonas aquimaris]MCW8108585.1 cell division protein ZipA [Alteromonas aquimaris]